VPARLAAGARLPSGRATGPGGRGRLNQAPDNKPRHLLEPP
jgi:hypothetical protein